jgi:hypothetical protein
MTQTAFNRDNILSNEERAVSARKCVSILADVNPEKFRERDWDFFCDQKAMSKNVRYNPTERQLLWLRDLVERLAT